MQSGDNKPTSEQPTIGSKLGDAWESVEASAAPEKDACWSNDLSKTPRNITASMLRRDCTMQQCRGGDHTATLQTSSQSFRSEGLPVLKPLNLVSEQEATSIAATNTNERCGIPLSMLSVGLA